MKWMAGWMDGWMWNEGSIARCDHTGRECALCLRHDQDSLSLKNNGKNKNMVKKSQTFFIRGFKLNQLSDSTFTLGDFATNGGTEPGCLARLCRSRSCCRVNFQWHSSQGNGRAVVWVMMCDRKLNGRVNRLWQTGQT